jgi:hypothetical protein
LRGIVAARIVGFRVHRSEIEAALAKVSDLLGRTGSSSGAAKVLLLLEHVQAVAHAQGGDVEGARQALDARLDIHAVPAMPPLNHAAH